MPVTGQVPTLPSVIKDVFAAASAELRAVYDAVDWPSTVLGPVEGWSHTLVSTIDLMLHSRFPMSLFWGPKYKLLYNDAFVELIGVKHPAALGRPAEVVFDEAWQQIGPLMEGVARTGRAHIMQDALVPLDRRGFLEDCYFTFCYSAVREADGEIVAVLDVAAETTTSVEGRRRLEVLAGLAGMLAGAPSLEGVRERALGVLREYDEDILAVDLRLPETDPAEYVRDLPARPPRELMASEVLVEEGRLVWLVLESDTDDRATSLLVVRLSPRVVVDDNLADTTRLVGSIIGRALGRTRVVAAEQARRDSERRLSETWQRSLLSQPVQPDGLRVGVRYVPAAEDAQVGGDWYDAFILPSDDLCLVIGDVTGHDRESAAGMAQLRNLLRGVSMTLGEPPAAVLGVLDRAVDQLAINVIATVIVAQVERDETTDDGGSEGGCTVRWSNAGHPPPALLLPDGTVRVLSAAADPLLGVDSFERHDHTEALMPGSSLVLYTDGLLERRGESMDSGLVWLERALTGQQDLDPDALCDLLITWMPPGVEDDVALLVLRVDSRT